MRQNDKRHKQTKMEQNLLNKDVHTEHIRENKHQAWSRLDMERIKFDETMIKKALVR